MIADPKLKTLQELIGNSTREELIWINGYLEGIVHQTSPAETPSKPLVGKLTIAYGTDTGNSKKLASEFASKAKKFGMNARLHSLDQYRLSDLLKEDYFFLVISTHGDGEPPAAARKFYDYVHENALQLGNLNYSVLALGDTAYPLFCKAGEDVDVRLETLGAKRIYPLQKCDTDYESEAHAWFDNVLKTAGSGAPSPVAQVARKKATGKKIYQGTILANVNLNGRGSTKKTYHMEIAADGVEYEPGDSIGVVPENPAEVVAEVIQLAGVNPSKKIPYRDEELPVETLLRRKLNIIYLPERVVKQYALIVGQEIPATRIDMLNLLKIYPVRDASQFEEVVGILEPITPRLYSIASSRQAHDGEVHITVAKKCFEVNEEVRNGLCSDYLATLGENSALEFYVHRNSLFKLPAPNEDVIMIGPGTGIAPFRAFLEERDATGAGGRNWLFFGDQHFQTDFLYQSEIQQFHETGVLTKVNVAFSRDQAYKIYVQQRLEEQGAEIFQWLASGAHLYLCGTEKPMSVDVENCLLEIIGKHGELNSKEAIEFLEGLKNEGRYHKDVY